MIQAVYERIVIEGPRLVGLRLTQAAYRHEEPVVAQAQARWRPAL